VRPLILLIIGERFSQESVLLWLPKAATAQLDTAHTSRSVDQHGQEQFDSSAAATRPDMLSLDGWSLRRGFCWQVYNNERLQGKEAIMFGFRKA